MDSHSAHGLTRLRWLTKGVDPRNANDYDVPSRWCRRSHAHLTGSETCCFGWKNTVAGKPSYVGFGATTQYLDNTTPFRIVHLFEQYHIPAVWCVLFVNVHVCRATSWTGLSHNLASNGVGFGDDFVYVVGCSKYFSESYLMKNGYYFIMIFVRIIIFVRFINMNYKIISKLPGFRHELPLTVLVLSHPVFASRCGRKRVLSAYEWCVDLMWFMFMFELGTTPNSTIKTTTPPL